VPGKKEGTVTASPSVSSEETGGKIGSPRGHSIYEYMQASCAEKEGESGPSSCQNATKGII